MPASPVKHSQYIKGSDDILDVDVLALPYAGGKVGLDEDLEPFPKPSGRATTAFSREIIPITV